MVNQLHGGRLDDPEAGGQRPKREVPVLTASKLRARAEEQVELSNLRRRLPADVHRRAYPMSPRCRQAATEGSLARDRVRRHVLLGIADAVADGPEDEPGFRVSPEDLGDLSHPAGANSAIVVQEGDDLAARKRDPGVPCPGEASLQGRLMAKSRERKPGGAEVRGVALVDHDDLQRRWGQFRKAGQTASEIGGTVAGTDDRRHCEWGADHYSTRVRSMMLSVFVACRPAS